MENRSFYNEILTEHNLRPAHKHDLADANLVLEGVNPSCGDRSLAEAEGGGRSDPGRGLCGRRLRHFPGLRGYYAGSGDREGDGGSSGAGEAVLSA